MVTRRRFLQYGAVAGGLSALGLQASSPAGALSPAEYVLNDFDSGAYPGENELGEWSEHVAFEAASVDDGVLRLEYDDGGFFATNVLEDVSDFDELVVRIRGDDGGEGEDALLRVGDVRAPFAELADDTVETEFQYLTVDFDDVGVDPETIDDVRLNFWQGGSGAVEIDSVFLVSIPEPLPNDVGPETTLDEFHDPSSYEFSEFEVLADVWTQYLPSELGDGYGDYDRTRTPDEEKADAFDVDLDAIEAGVEDRSLTFAEMGTQALDWVQQFEQHGFPRHASEKLLPRLSLLPGETEEPVYHNPPEWVWEQTAGPTAATNDPALLIQDPWPPDAPHYQPRGHDLRDRSHDQARLEGDPDHEWYDEDVEWTEYTELPDEIYRDEDHPLLAIADGVNPVTGESFDGDGFTANAPMAMEAKIHVEHDGYVYQLLEFENTSPVPYHLNSTVIVWIGPSGANGSLIDGHYSNEQRPTSGFGHPQRDVIEVVYDEERDLSAYAVRIAFHDRPYNMRTAYPNQKWSLEIGTELQSENYDDAERQAFVDTMVESCHVEVETDMDGNMAWMDELELRNRLNN